MTLIEYTDHATGRRLVVDTADLPDGITDAVRAASVDAEAIERQRQIEALRMQLAGMPEPPEAELLEFARRQHPVCQVRRDISDRISYLEGQS